MICDNCGTEHNGSYGSGRFCCLRCARSFIAKKRHAEGKYRDHLNKLHKQRQNRNHWTCLVCGEIFDSRSLLSTHRKTYGHRIGGPGALHGKTKESSSICRKISDTMKNKYAKGNIINPFKGKHLTNEHKERISEGRQKTLDTNLRCGRRLDVKWYKVKNLNGDEYTVRGHWEENVANKLTEKSILWTRGKRLKYFDTYWHTYTPDFHLPNQNAFIEVKGYYPEEDKNKMNLVIKYNPGVKIYFIGMKEYKEFIQYGELLEKYLLCGDSYKSGTTGSEPVRGGAIPSSPAT